jgi:hypothetical protein
MIPFDKQTFCQRCESEIKIGGLLKLPGSEDFVHYCLECAIGLAVEHHHETGGSSTIRTQFIEIDPTQGEDDE